ncbi:MAG: hypothetical protein Kow0068_16560 [Marinilabiliales bacterium]
MAQKTVPATGGEATGSGGTVSYTVGQVAYQTNSETSGTVSEGVQQPYEIFITSIEDVEEVTLSVTAFPNPTTDYLTLSIEEYDLSNLSYKMFDMNGRLIQSKEINSNQTKIEMNSLLPATYFIKVFDGNKEIVTYKIIKN